MTTKERTNIRKAKDLFRQHDGMLSASRAIQLGVHPRTLYAMRDTGRLQQISRGLYRLADLPPLTEPDLVAVSLRAPRGVICLISALSFHEITTLVPHEVYLAMRKGDERPRIGYPPVRVFWFGGAAFSEGIKPHTLDGTGVRVYAAEKTLADCFKFRNRIGLDAALEALKLYRQRKRVDVDALIHFARVCRVENVMRPYLEAIL
ncbi:type IV toxin-antitoxin system AbiEi family antitoxin domain-containing protein [Candidatus Poribacteria bacterium]|nr:type IV toxin-antitoxin system AbiEi family antitoxin domain-containing protein [Candidatus Poribacteria bacterium]